MAILDIRTNENEAITGIKFDSTDDLLVNSNPNLAITGSMGKRILCSKDNIDNLIKALQKAKELWA